MKAWLQAEAESRIERAQNRRTRTSLHWPSGTRVCYWRSRCFRVWVPLPTIRQGATALLNKHKGAWLGPFTVLAQEKGRSQEQHEEAHGTVWIVVHGRLTVHLNTCDISLNERVCHSIETKKSKERPRTFIDIVQDFKFSKGTHVDLRSQSDPPDGSEPRHLSGNVWNEFE